MNNIQIERILNKIMGPISFRGVYPADAIPSAIFHEPFPFGIVVNTDSAGLPGTHWQAIWVVGKNSVEFFDSFGHPPKGLVKTTLKSFIITKQNKVNVQSIKEVSCGPHVIYFLTSRYRQLSFYKIIERLKRNKPFIDLFVKFFVLNLIKK